MYSRKGDRELNKARRMNAVMLFLGGLIVGVLFAVAVATGFGRGDDGYLRPAVDFVELDDTAITILTAYDAQGREITVITSDNTFSVIFNDGYFEHIAEMDEEGEFTATSSPIDGSGQPPH